MIFVRIFVFKNSEKLKEIQNISNFQVLQGLYMMAVFQ